MPRTRLNFKEKKHLMKQTPRLFIYTADMVRISGKCERSCQRLMQKMREHFGLQKGQVITLHQASKYLNVPTDQLAPYLMS